MYIHNRNYQQKMNIKQRMLMEVSKSIETSICIMSPVHYLQMLTWRVHADINTNPNFKSNDALKEAMGYIMGMGFEFKSQTVRFCQLMLCE